MIALPLLLGALAQVLTAEPPTVDVAIPRVTDAQRTAPFWTERIAPDERSRTLLSRADILALNARLIATAARPSDVLKTPGSTLEARKLDARKRLDRYAAEITTQLLTTPDGDTIGEARLRVEALTKADQLRPVHTEADLRCLPSALPIYKVPVDTDFDRNQCSGLHPGEVLRILGVAPDGWLFVSAGHSTGWVTSDALGPPMTAGEARAFQRPKQSLVFVRDARPWRLGTRFPLVADESTGWQIRVPSPVGLVTTRVPKSDAAVVGSPALTREAALDVAFSLLGEPYGWGDRAGNRDCSRFVLDVLAVFGLELGRNSLMQSRQGSEVIDVVGLSDDDKRLRLREAGGRGVVLLYMPGHIMLYLGDVDGQPYALSALSEFAEPSDDGERVRRIDRVAVSDLELGRGTSRQAFIERITAIVVFGEPGAR